MDDHQGGGEPPDRDDDDFEESTFDDDEYDYDEAGEAVELDRAEAVLVRRDLDDLAAFRSTFEPDGFKGVSLFCTDCVEEHYYEWDMLEHNLSALLESGETPVHEPAFDPRPEEYVNWEYAQGYIDGIADSGVQGPLADLDDDACPFCAAPLAASATPARFCAACGQHLGPARLAAALEGEGWGRNDVDDLLRAAGLPLPHRRDR